MDYQENSQYDPSAVLESLYTQYTKDSIIDESTQFPSIPTGKYRIQVDKREIFPAGDLREKPIANLVGRQFASLSAPVAKDGKKYGRVFFKVSWEERRTDKGGLDKVSQAWGQLMDALSCRGKSVGATLEAVMQYPIDVTVNEQYIDEKGTWHTITTDEQRKAAREAGRNIVNVLQRIEKAKAE
jgi:hypothetical protein